MRRTTTKGLVLVTAVTMMALAACSSDDGSNTDTTAAPTAPLGSSSATTSPTDDTTDMSGVSLKIATSTENNDTLIRDQSGAFTDTPYAIEWVEFSGSNATLEALTAGAIDTAVLQAPSAVLSVANADTPWTADDAPFLAVAAWETPGTPGFQLLVHPGSGITDVADLAGKKVAFAKGALGHYFWAEAARAAGLSAGDVEEVILPAVDGRAAYLAGEVDALITGNRTAVMLMGEGDAESIAVSRDYTAYSTLTVVRRGLLDDPAALAAVEDYLGRYEALHQWMAGHAAELAERMVEVMEMTPDDALLVAETESRVRVPLAGTTEALQDMADVFFEVGAADVQVDITVLFDLRLEQGAVQQT